MNKSKDNKSSVENDTIVLRKADKPVRGAGWMRARK